MKVLKILLAVLLCSAVIGLLCYQGFVTKYLEVKDLLKGILILAGLVLAFFRPRRRGKVSNKKAAYQKAYSEFIQNVFDDEPKLEKKFYNAVDDYNCNKPSAAIHKLEALRKECRRSTELYAVTVFTALCLDNMKAYEKAIAQYDAAMSIRPNSTLASNTGLCYERLGQTEKAMEAYGKAVDLNPGNAVALNNMGALHFRDGDYIGALEYAEDAIEADPRMPQALSLAAICSALLGDQEGYTRYYRQAVSSGYDGRKIKEVIKALDPN